MDIQTVLNHALVRIKVLGDFMPENLLATSTRGELKVGSNCRIGRRSASSAL